MPAQRHLLPVYLLGTFLPRTALFHRDGSGQRFSGLRYCHGRAGIVRNAESGRWGVSRYAEILRGNRALFSWGNSQHLRFVSDAGGGFPGRVILGFCGRSRSVCRCGDRAAGVSEPPEKAEAHFGFDEGGEEDEQPLEYHHHRTIRRKRCIYLIIYSTIFSSQSPYIQLLRLIFHFS